MLCLVFVFFAVDVQARYENVNIKRDWWESALFYQIYPRSFVDSDGDGIGDMNGITSRLEYLKDLGVDAVWLSPIFKSPMHDFGYDVMDYYNIQSEYGSFEDFEQMLQKANELNIKVLLDFVPNHTSNESEWFIKSASRDEYYNDWYVWENGHIDSLGHKKAPNNWVSLFRKSAWTYKPGRDQFYLHQFSESEPDLNYRNPVVVEEIKNVIKYWLEKGVAGMRINSINYLYETDKDLFGGHYPDEPLSGKPGAGPDDYDYLEHVYTRDQEETYDLLSQFREVFDSITLRDNFTRILITVANTSIKNSVRYYGDRIHAGAHIPVNGGLIDDLNKESDARDIKLVVDRWISYKPLGKHANWMVGNHDKSRVASRFRPQLVDAFNMLVLLLPGIAFTYMGEEIGMTNGFLSWGDTKDPLACNTDDPVNYIEVSRDPARTPFQWSSGKNAGFSSASKTWLPVAEGYESLNLATQRSAVRSHYQVYRTLTTLRRRPAFRCGRYESLALTNDVFAFKRWYNDDTYIIAMNIGKSYQVVNLTAFDLVFGQMEVEVSSVLSSRTYRYRQNFNIKVVLDLVPNHTSNESLWFQEALNGNEKYYNYFVWEDGVIDENGNKHPPNNWLSHFRGSAWEYREEVGKYYLHQFVVGQPDLNYRNPDVVEEMKNIIRFWLNKGVAGFRVDAVNCLFEVDKELFGGKYPDEPFSGRTDVDPESHDYLSHIYTKDQDETYYMVYQWRDVFDEFEAQDGFPRVMMTEVYATIQNVVRYFGEGEKNGAQMPFNFDLITDVDASSSAADIKRAVDKFLTYKPVDKDANWVVGNHDNSRMATRYGPSLVDGINMIVLLLPGVGVTYMGEELGMVDGFVSWEDTVDPSGCNTNDPINYVNSSRDPERTPFQWNGEKNAGFSAADKTWLPVADGYETLNVEVQKLAERSHLKVYQSLADLRQEKVFRYGRYDSLAMNNDVFVFKRWYKGDIYLVVVNMRDTEYEVDLTYFENVSGDVSVVVRSIQSPKNEGDIFDASALPVAGYEGIVLKLN